MKIKSDFIYNISFSVLPQLMNILTYLLLPAMIIVGYGSETNGLVSTVRSIISYISLVGAGIAVATTQSLYEPVAKKDLKQVKGLLKATAYMFNRCGYLYVLLVVIVSCMYPFFVKCSLSYGTMFFLLFVMSVSGASEFFVVGKYRSLLFANRKVYICSLIQTLSLFLSLIIAVVLLKFRMNIVLVQLGISFVYVARAFFLSLYVHRYYSECLYDCNTEPISKAVEKKNDAMIHQLSGLLVMSSQTIILTIMVGLEASSIYVVYNIVFSGLYSIFSNIQSSVTPYLGKSFAVENAEILEKKFAILEKVSYLVIFVVLAVSAKMILPFVALYTRGSDINYSYEYFALLFVVFYVFLIFRMPYMAMINVAGHFRETKSRALIESAICVLACIFFTYLLGLYGVLIGSACAIGWRCVDMIVYARRKILGLNFVRPLFRLLRIIIYIWVFYNFSPKQFFEISSYLTWLVNALINCVICLLIALFDYAIFEGCVKVFVKK